MRRGFKLSVTLFGKGSVVGLLILTRGLEVGVILLRRERVGGVVVGDEFLKGIFMFLGALLKYADLRQRGFSAFARLLLLHSPELFLNQISQSLFPHDFVPLLFCTLLLEHQYFLFVLARN